ncbi:MAG: hypothetical protein JNL84_04110, partial [Candidatus Accumulibacter sp.]|nr:hypothetical protein [Accumulibacter sp.]
SKSLTVNNAAPSLTLSGNATTNEGATYTLNLVGSDPAGSNDPLNYSIDWGDGTAVQNLTAAQLAALGGNVSHSFADDQDGPVNSTPRSIQVTVSDGDGGSTQQTKAVNVNNVAPTLGATGAATATAGVSYSLSLANYVDPGADTLAANGLRVNWGDGTSTTYSALGVVNHIYAAAGPNTIRVSLTDEDGSYSDVSTLAIHVNPAATQTVRIGGAPVRETGTNKEWTVAWTNSHVSIEHKADYTNAAEAYTPVKFTGALPNLLSGNDVFAGDLGVSGQSEATSSVRQEIDGKESLRFNLDQGATGLTLFLNRFFSQDDGTGFVESGRLRLLDASGNVVGEKVFSADNLAGTKQVTISSATAFTSVEINAGVYDGANFMFGAHTNPDGSFGAPVTSDAGGVKHGSDFIVDALEFQLPVLGVPLV